MKVSRLKEIIRESVFSTLFGNGNKREKLDIEQEFHFSEIPTRELYSQYVDYSFESSSEGYRIDTRQLPNDIAFYGDPNYPKGYFTKQLIPSNCLSLVETIQV